MTTNSTTSSTISSVSAYECLDSRGYPTLSVSITLEDGSYGTSMVPSGASTGEHEAHELRDGDMARYGGKGTAKAVKSINTSITQSLKGLSALNQIEIDQKLIDLDGTENKSKLGANAILGVSLATAQAAASASGIPLFSYLRKLDTDPNSSAEFILPAPLVNVINGGAHATNSLDFQEFMLVPHGKSTFAENIRMAAEVFHQLKKLLVAKNYSTGVGDEGGFAPNFSSQDEALDFLMNAIEKTGYTPGQDISIALDCAASEFFDKATNAYHLKKSGGGKKSAEELVALYSAWLDRYPIVSIEDGLDENDWEGWQMMTSAIGEKTQLVGDDLFVTNPKRLNHGIETKAGNAILIKPNQIGTVTETIEAVTLAHQAKYKSVISHRSGETEDTFIADLTVALNAGQIKTGSVSRGERTAKYNRLLWIEDHLKDKAKFVKTM